MRYILNYLTVNRGISEVRTGTRRGRRSRPRMARNQNTTFALNCKTRAWLANACAALSNWAVPGIM